MRLASTRRFAAIAVAALALTACSRSGEPTAPDIASNPDGAGADSVTLLEDLSARQVLPTDNWWNLDVSNAPVDANSDAFIDWISGRTPQNPTATRVVHPDFGPPPYGIPYVTVDANEPLVPYGMP